MLQLINISEKGKKKIHIYTASMYLFNIGKSHPQIVNILADYEPDLDILIPIVDKAMREDWDKLYTETNKLFSEDFNYDEVLNIISQKESDPEISYWICNEWYKYKTVYAECIILGKTNRLEGSKWVIICSVALIVVFYLNASIITKSIWGIVLLASIVQWIVGLQQKDIANTINNFFTLNLENDTSENNP